MMADIILAGACVLAVYVALGAFASWLRREIEEIMNELDANLAKAIQKILTDLPIGDIEPPNPVQMMIMQLIQDNMKPKTITAQVRDEAGLFTAAESES
tara:strand:+ start:376 stop:672 length:297 start_codon:yes stop_codon:yes gene_type:complete